MILTDKLDSLQKTLISLAYIYENTGVDVRLRNSLEIWAENRSINIHEENMQHLD